MNPHLGSTHSRARDRIGAGFAAFDNLDVHERDTGAISPFKELAVLGRDRQDDLRDVIAVDERLGSPEPNGPADEIGVDFLLFGIAKSRRFASSRQNDRKLIHGMNPPHRGVAPPTPRF